MPELLCHLFGDYILQNHWMANTKTRSWVAALVHALFYTLPFLLLTLDPVALAVICGTHALIDRYRLAFYWVNFWGVGVEGEVVPLLRRASGVRGQPVEPAPPFIEFWLCILVDNTAHLTINHLALYYL